jgi:hypothetical protein
VATQDAIAAVLCLIETLPLYPNWSLLQLKLEGGVFGR